MENRKTNGEIRNDNVYTAKSGKERIISIKLKILAKNAKIR